jgi:VanZ family protein
LNKIIPGAEFVVENLNHIVRKNAHFFAYLLLGLLVTNALINSDIRRIKCIILAAAICVLYASSDEIHQLFVPGRGGMVMDVVIDSAGAVIGICIIGVLRIRALVKN